MAYVSGPGSWGRKRSGRRRLSTLVTVTAADPGRRFAFRVTAPLVPIADCQYTFEQAGAGCRLEEVFVDRRWPPVKTISALRTGIADRAAANAATMRRTLTAVKAAAETRVDRLLPAMISGDARGEDRLAGSGECLDHTGTSRHRHQQRFAGAPDVRSPPGRPVHVGGDEP